MKVRASGDPPAMAASGDPDVAAGVAVAGAATVAGEDSSTTVNTTVLAAAGSCFPEAATGASSAEVLFAGAVAGALPIDRALSSDQISFRQIKDPCSLSPSHCLNINWVRFERRAASQKFISGGIIPYTPGHKKRKAAVLGDECGDRGAPDAIDLPPELLHCIARHLDFFPDLASFASVCKSWLSIERGIVGSRDWFRGQSPLLMLPPPADEFERTSSSSARRREFFSLSHGRGFKLRFPAAGRDRKKFPKLCIGASRGWLVLLDREKLEWSNVELLNPFTKVSVRLPPVAKSGEHYRYDHEYQFAKVVVSGDPSTDYKGGGGGSSSSSTSGSCVVMMFWGPENLLLCRPGDVCWTVVEHTQYWFAHEVVLFRGLYHAIAKDGPDGGDGLSMISFDPSCKLNDSATQTQIPKPILKPSNLKFGLKYLVESSGQLLLIIRRLVLVSTIDPRYRTSGFDVFRLDWQRAEWTEVHGLGEQMIFIGYNESVSLPSRDRPGWRGNCIYFTDIDGSDGACFRDSGVFDFGDRTISSFPISDKQPWSEPLVWLIQDIDCKSSGI